MTSPALPEQYLPFPDEVGRNWRQVHLEIPLMLAALAIPRGVRVLEVGCGRGVALAPIGKHLRPAHLVGVDLDDALLAVAQASAPGVELVRADVRRLPFSNGQFDVVLDFGTCYHIAQPDVALAEIARVLAPGGMLATESKLSQVLSHPVRTRGRRLPWHAAPSLVPMRSAVLWESRRRIP